ncbi:AMP-binding protein [Kitasatospora sp. NPDC002040]|uniref:AMP-binding protein n=1 Tax=Kitasatospora sp. NPDC002040 TaxID=3154661 RepID=UPI0033168942
MVDLQRRTSELIGDFFSPDADPAWLLCDRHPSDAPAFTLIAEDLTVRGVTFGELRARSLECAAALAGLGVGAGDRVATLMGKSIDLVSVMLGIWRLGAVYVPLFTAFGPQAIGARLAGSQARVVVTDAQQRTKLRTGPDLPAERSWATVVAADAAGPGEYLLAELRRAADPADLPERPRGGDRPLVHMFTSGTTGAPKGVVHPVAYIAACQSYLEHGLGLTGDDVYWCAADPGWGYGLYSAVVAPLAAGHCSVLVSGRFDAATTWSVLSSQAVTNFAAAPTVYRALRASGSVPEGVRLRRASSAGEPLTPDVSDWAERELGVRVHDHFGQTEVGMVLADCWHPALARPAKPRSMGRCLPGWRLQVLDGVTGDPVEAGVVGRIAVDVRNSPLMTFHDYQGAEHRTEKFTADGASYLTGDLGHMDTDGDFFFVSRDDDVILMAGYRIGPFDIESVLLQHPGVAECAVIGAPDEARGEALEAYVVPSTDTVGTPELAAELQQLVKQRYAAHAYPRAVHFLDSLPRTPAGKIQRYLLRRRRVSHHPGTGE